MITINGIKMYSTEEVAALFNVSTMSITNYRRRGLLRSTHIGREKYTSEESIRDYLNGIVLPKEKKAKEKTDKDE